MLWIFQKLADTSTEIKIFLFQSLLQVKDIAIQSFKAALHSIYEAFNFYTKMCKNMLLLFFKTLKEIKLIKFFL